jgi:hypothetical protein
MMLDSTPFGGEFRDLIGHRLQTEIQHSSLYGARFAAGHGHPAY